QREEVVHRDAPLRGPRPEIAGEQLVREAVDAGRYGGVRGEQGARSDRGDGVPERRPLRKLTVDELEDEQARVAFVEVVLRRLDTERGERTCAAHAEHELLAKAVLLVAAVEP